MLSVAALIQKHLMREGERFCEKEGERESDRSREKGRESDRSREKGRERERKRERSMSAMPSIFMYKGLHIAAASR